MIPRKPHPKTKKLVTSNHKLATTQKTSWGSVASWYDKHLEKDDDSYHAKVIFPNTLRLLGDTSGKKILDLACGQGAFSRILADTGATVLGVDIAQELIDIAESKGVGQKKMVFYYTTSSDDLYMIKDKTQDIVVSLLALQNIENVAGTFKECTRVLKDHGKLIFVLNHPAFRIPQKSSWGYDEAEKVQYRRIDEYLSESKVKIDMTPGSFKDKKFTVSFHRSLQVWSKLLQKHGFAIARMEEWESHRESGKGPRQKAEDKSRKEIPLFLCVEAIKV